MTTHVEDVTTRVGLVIDGGTEAGGAGTYPVTNPARPSADGSWIGLKQTEAV